MSDTPFLEVRIPITPVDHYYNRIRFIAQSIRTLGGRYRDTRIRVTVGADRPPEDLHRRLPWSRALGIDWHWVDRAEFATWKDTAHPYIATMMERFRPPFGAPNVLMLDADIVALRPFDELFDLLLERPGVIGVMAHASPFIGRNATDHVNAWRYFYNASGLGEPKFEFILTGWGLMDSTPERRLSPPYFNTGVLLGTSAALETLYAPYMSALDFVRSKLDTYFFEQIALTLALMKTGITYHVAPLRYNYPNDPRFDGAYAEELEQTRFLHFLRTDIVRREADFETLESVAQLTARRDLTGSNEIFRRRISELLPLTVKA